MSYVAVFDIGTTAVKGLLMNKRADIFGEYSVSLETYTRETGIVEQQPEDWWAALKQIALKWWESDILPEDIIAMTFSGQMEDTITLSKSDKHYPAILYSDSRARVEAEVFREQAPDIFKVTGNHVSATTPLAKIKWLEANKKDQFSDCAHFVFSSKDYAIFRLTGEAVTDPITGSTTGLMDLKKTEWAVSILEAAQIDLQLLPRLLEVHDVVGSVTEQASRETGFSTKTVVINGSGDAGATTLGSGTINENEGYFYLGTTGWLAVTSQNKVDDIQSEGHFNLAFVENKKISVLPLLNVGNVHKWAVETFIDEKVEDKYAQFELLIQESEPGSHGIVFLPYLNGERNPMIDVDAKGAYWGIHSQTDKKDLARATLEGVTFSLKQTLDMFDIHSNQKMTLIGGGAKSREWCQMIADIMNHPIRVPFNHEYLPSLGIVSTAFLAVGWSETYDDFVGTYIHTLPREDFIPNEERVKEYAQHYASFLKLYPSVRSMYA